MLRWTSSEFSVSSPPLAPDETPLSLILPSGSDACSVDVDMLAPYAWDNLVGGFADKSYDQTASYAAGQADPWSRRLGLEALSQIVLRDDGHPIAGALIRVTRMPLMRCGVASVRFGPIWRRYDRRADPALYRAAVRALVDEYCGRRRLTLSVVPRPHPIYHELECRILREFGFAAPRSFPDGARRLIDLTLGPDERLARLDAHWRDALEQALGNDIAIKFYEGGDQVGMVRSLYSAAGQGDPCDVDCARLVPDLFSRLPAPMRPRVVLACVDGRPVSAAAIAILGDGAHYLCGVGDDTARLLRADHALHWWIIQFLAQRGVHWYDLGSDAADPELRDFKAALASRGGATVTMPGAFEYCPSAVGRVASDSIRALRDVGRGMQARRRIA